MHDLLLRNIAEQVTLTKNEEHILISSFTPKRLRKGQLLLEQGEVCSHFTFVSTGSLVSLVINENKSKHVLSFAFEGWWAGDLCSIFNNEPSQLDIEALEACELLQLRAVHQKTLFEQVPAYERYVRIKYQNTFLALQKRLENTLGLSAEEKYNNFLKQSPLIQQKASLNLVASYLGVTPGTLTRLRRTKSLYYF